MKRAIDVFAEFWQSFARDPLYDTGFADAVLGSGATKADDLNVMIEAMCFINGYAQCARLASPHDGPHRRIAHTIACIAGATASRFQAQRDEDGQFHTLQAERLVESYTAELTGLVREKAGFAP